jgi:6-phosphogluconolactonase
MATVERRYGQRILRIADTADELVRAVADALVSEMAEVLAHQEVFRLALSGGNTPRALYRLLAQEYRQGVGWQHVHLFWGDERYVPHDHHASNYRMARETLIEPLNIPLRNIHPMPTDKPNPHEAAARYEQELRHFFGMQPNFDLILLGMGTDGHTASLFPGTPALQERTRWVTVGEAPSEPRIRLTLTLPVLNAAHTVYFVVTGEDKAQAVRRILIEQEPLPAALVQPEQGELIWWLDSAAATAV